MCPKFVQICHAFRFEFGYVLCVSLWTTHSCGKTHNFWHPFPYFRMGIDSDAKIDPKLVYFCHIPIIYTQTSVVSVFLRFVRRVSAWIAFRPWVFAILLFSPWVWVRKKRSKNMLSVLTRNPISNQNALGVHMEPMEISWAFRLETMFLELQT